MKNAQSRTPRAFLWRLGLFVLAFLLLGGAVMYAVDPYFQYRLPEADYVLADRFCMENMARRFDYDAALIGSSMCQNFDMDALDEALDKEVFKGVKGGLTIAEATELLNWTAETGQADTILLTLDVIRFNMEEPEEYYPSYLKNETVLDDWRYLYGYEAWMRYLPMDTAALAFHAAGRELPSVLKAKTEPDLVGRWAERATYPGEEALVRNYLEGQGTVSSQAVLGMEERMKKNFDLWLENEPFDEDTTYYVFLCPYSSLYWAHTVREGSFEPLLSFRRYYYERLSAYDNVVFFDFQSMEKTRDLSLFKDISHYHPELNDDMTTAFANLDYVATPESMDETEAFIRESVAELMEKYPALQQGAQ